MYGIEGDWQCTAYEGTAGGAARVSAAHQFRLVGRERALVQLHRATEIEDATALRGENWRWRDARERGREQLGTADEAKAAGPVRAAATRSNCLVGRDRAVMQLHHAPVLVADGATPL